MRSYTFSDPVSPARHSSRQTPKTDQHRSEKASGPSKQAPICCSFVPLGKFFPIMISPSSLPHHHCGDLISTHLAIQYRMP